MIFWLVLKRKISNRGMISWTILVFCRGFFWRLYFCMVKYLNFYNSFFCLKILFNVNGKATVWHTSCWSVLQDELGFVNQPSFSGRSSWVLLLQFRLVLLSKKYYTFLAPVQKRLIELVLLALSFKVETLWCTQKERGQNLVSLHSMVMWSAIETLQAWYLEDPVRLHHANHHVLVI
jgi:hypothetical protein